MRVLGHTIDLGVLSTALPRLEEQWSRCMARPGDVPDEVVDLGRHHSERYDYAAVTQITLSAVALSSGHRLNLHAAGLASADGRVLTLVAPSGTGKTTACRLLGRDLAYVTDECVSVGEAGDIVAFEKPLAVRPEGSDDPEARVVVGPDQLGLARAAGPLRAGPVVILDRRPDITVPRLLGADWVGALLDLVPQTSALPRLRRPLGFLVDHLRRVGGPRRLVYTEIESAAPLLHALLAAPGEGSDRAAPPVTTLPHWGEVPDPTTGPCPGMRPDGRGAVVRRTAWTDAVRVGDEVLVMLGTQLVVLSGAGAVLWSSIGPHGATADELWSAGVDTLGPHPNARRIIDATIDDLCDAGVLTT